MLKEQIRHIVESNPEYAAITPVIEKEILHHDIIDVMVKQGAMQSLVFLITTEPQPVSATVRASLAF